MNELVRFVVPLLALLALGMAVLLIAWVIRYVAGSKERPGGSDESVSRLAASNPDTTRQSEQEPVLCVSRTRGGALAVTVQGRPYSRLRDIKDPAVGRLAVDAVKGVLFFAEELLPSAVRRSLRSAERPMEARGNTKVMPEPAGEKAQLTPRQLVDEIDELVQARVRDLPELAERGIRLRQGPGGGLLIFVGNERYESVDRIADDDARSLIREAIQEWERR